ncbi:MDR family MFS transporter [Secundilactobacillus paracollinoides]|uniref:MDR family MFS transporter n=1 Tax=Secundilactobacillus paracollinoides TaxID=240427 RepID=UPI00070552FC|nr:MDR family MFS transporter [Secundilactobacillus paracollinoides]
MNRSNELLDVHGRKYNRMLLVLSLLLGSFTTFMTVTMLINAFPSLMNDFNVSADTVEWLTNGTMLVMGIMVPISAFLMNRVSTKVLYLSAMALFIVGLSLSAVATNFTVLLIGRLVAAIGTGITAPLVQTTLLTIYPVNERGMAMGLNGLIVALAPAVGPTLSGWLLLHYSWRMLFLSVLPIAIVVFLLALFSVRDVLENTHPSLDIVSIIESSAGFGLLLYAFTEVATWGWENSKFYVYLVISLILIYLFGWRQFKLDKPVLDLSILKSGRFLLTTIIVAINYIAMVGIEMVFTLYIQTIIGESAFHAGLLLFPGAIAVAITSMISGRTFDKVGAKGMGLAGFILIILGGLSMTKLDSSSSLIYIMAIYAVRMIGIGLVLMPITTAGMNSLTIDKMSHGTSINNTFRQVAGSIGTAVLMSILTNETKSNMPVKHVLTRTPLLYKRLAETAELKGYHLAFLFCVFFCVVGVALVLFLPNDNSVKEG